VKIGIVKFSGIFRISLRGAFHVWPLMFSQGEPRFPIFFFFPKEPNALSHPNGLRGKFIGAL
jgi:hypothetical protein